MAKLCERTGGIYYERKYEHRSWHYHGNTEVIAKYAGSVAVECFGIVGMAAVNMKDGLVRLLKKDSLTHGIQVTISDNNEITLNFQDRKSTRLNSSH